MKRALLIGLVAVCGTLFGEGRCVEYGGEFLALRPTTCDFPYVIRDPRTLVASGVLEELPQGAAISIDPEYAIGFRLYTTTLFCWGTADIRVDYAHLYTSQNGRVELVDEGSLWPVPSPPATDPAPVTVSAVPTDPLPLFRANAQRVWDAGNVELGRRGCKCNAQWRLFGGIHIVSLQDRFVLRDEGKLAVVPGLPIRRILRFEDLSLLARSWGAGPRLGGEFTQTLCWGIGVTGKVGVGLLAGEREDTSLDSLQFTFFQTGFPPSFETFQDLNVKGGKRAHLFPEIDARLGLTYSLCLCGAKLTAEAGYEFTSYINALARRSFNDQRATLQTDCYSFNLNGFYAGLKLQI
ncbi:MAG: Lpg1974 family pore-forming outer membrane protein [Parachlamydiales bacterium]